MRYESQKVSYYYFAFAGLVFFLQLLFGLVGALQYFKPDLFLNFMPFNVTRTIHINTLVVWLLMGFMGATYYIVPEEADSELYSLNLARFQFWLLSIGAIIVVLGYLFDGVTSHRFNVEFLGSGIFNEGREYIEAPRWVDIVIIIGVLVFLFNVVMTTLKAKRVTNTLGVLLAGLVGLAIMYLPGVVFQPNISKDQFWWWWVVHYWVEGTWEVIGGAVLAFMLMKLTGVRREVVEKWMFVEVGLVLGTGIWGMGHHYFWIGTPSYWLWIGSIWSAMEPVPLLIMVWDAFRTTRETRTPIANKPALYWTVGHALLNFIGAGLFGVVHTLAPINKWTHGTQVTPAHGHLAFYGAYVMLVISMAYIALPNLAGVKDYDINRGMKAFWWMTISMSLMALDLMGAGIVQVYMERMAGIDYTTVKMTYNQLFFILRFLFGLTFLWGAIYFFLDLIKLQPALATRAVSEEIRAMA